MNEYIEFKVTKSRSKENGLRDHRNREHSKIRNGKRSLKRGAKFKNKIYFETECGYKIK